MEEWNIATRCRDCHNDLDGHNFEGIQNFKDLNKIMLERLKHAPGKYNEFVTGLQEVGYFVFDYVEFCK